MRAINPATGKAFGRHQPVDWGFIRKTLNWRKAHKRLLDGGFQRVNAFCALPWESPVYSHRIVETAIHPDGMGLYVKIEPT